MAAAPHVHIEATVDPSLQTIEGEIYIDEATAKGPIRWVDPHTKLPLPTDDRTHFRTFPGRKERGKIGIRHVAPNRVRFYTIIPKRFGDIGAKPNRYLTANGGWYPQPILQTDGTSLKWTVRVTVPPLMTAAVGQTVGQNTIHWEGHGDRVSLVVFRKATQTTIQEHGIDVTVITPRKPRKVALKHLRTNLMRIRPPGVPLRGVLVERPLRRRIARSGNGQGYFSDRAWRLTPGLQHIHHVSVTRALLPGLLPIHSRFEGELAAAALSLRHQEELKKADVTGLLKKFSWNPLVHTILYDKTLPFWGDVFNKTHPTDPLKDDLKEALSPHTPGTVIVKKLLMHYNIQQVWALGLGIASGLPLEQAAESAGIDIMHVTKWTKPYPIQDYSLEWTNDAVWLKRTAQQDAQSEDVPVRINGELGLIPMPKGPSKTRLTTKVDVTNLTIDPQGLTGQTSRFKDSWPPKLLATVAAWVSSVNLQQKYVVGYAGAWFRGKYDTRNVTSISVYANAIDSPGVQIGWSHRWGPLQDGLSRPNRFGLSINSAFIDPRFHPDFDPDLGQRLFAVGATASYAWDTRVSSIFPQRGKRLFMSVSGGHAPATGEGWLTTRLGLTGIIPLHPRHVLAAKLSGGWAMGGVDDRKLRLGGTNRLFSFAPNAAIGDVRGIAKAEYRVAAIRNASIPFGVVWLDEIQGKLGVEFGGIHSEDVGLQWGLGLTGGTSFILDLLGAKPFSVGVDIGIPIPVNPSSVPLERPPQWMIRFGQGL